MEKKIVIYNGIPCYEMPIEIGGELKVMYIRTDADYWSPDRAKVAKAWTSGLIHHKFKEKENGNKES